MRPSTITAFAFGLTVGAIAIAAAATFTTAAGQHLPDCHTAIEVAP